MAVKRDSSKTEILLTVIHRLYVFACSFLLGWGWIGTNIITGENAIMSRLVFENMLKFMETSQTDFEKLTEVAYSVDFTWFVARRNPASTERQNLH